jgi:arylsulfatase A
MGAKCRASATKGTCVPKAPPNVSSPLPNTVPMIKRLALLGLLLASSCQTPVAQASVERRPNIVLIVADDLGYGDLGSYGQKLIQTPHLDRMAAEGLRFTDFYAGSPVCAPSRCTLMTGKHPGHAYVRDNWEAGGWNEGDAEGQQPLLPGTQTLGRVLQDAGYATACIGKWGLGGPGSTGAPLNQGFDHFYGYLCQRQAHNFYPTHLWNDNEMEKLDGNVWKNLTGPHYAHDLMTEDALSWTAERGDDPFFLLLTYTIPHLALQVPDDSMAPYIGEWEDPPYEGGKGYLPHATPRAAYAGMVSRMDRDVGRLLAQLKDMGVDEDTLVMFTSDNGATYDIGGAHSEFFESNGVLRGAKGSVYEGGLRVPLIARWPGHTEAGTTTDAVGAFWDFMPTLLDAAGVSAGPTLGSEDALALDGTSLLPVLTGSTPLEERSLYWEFPGYGNQQALREGDWMLIRRFLGTKAKTTTELFNLATDLSQKDNVAAEHPERVQRMLDRMEEEHVASPDFPLKGIDTPAK